jgi:hypothetical protein
MFLLLHIPSINDDDVLEGRELEHSYMCIENDDDDDDDDDDDCKNGGFDA